ncbi:MAG TPA: GH116 family glycosyl-hydrolase [Puia sp.]|nr:GH116 family glycosyl-hydrolase [Puia sp.]
MKRRKFLQSSGLLASAGFFTFRFPLIAGPFTGEDFMHPYFPRDKKLDSRWVRSLFERGTPTIYAKTRNELRFIGMPVGGICSGCVYAGGDGRLWLWDIFNQNQLGAVTKVLPVPLESFRLKEINNVEGTLYLEPLFEVSPLQQGFALSISQNGTTTVKRLQQDDWDEVTFEATYPVATVRYSDKKMALEVSVDLFSPFIPGNARDSGMPATIQAITMKNASAASPISVDILGWLENKMLWATEKKNASGITRVNDIAQNGSFKGISAGCKLTDKELEKAADFGDMCLASTDKNALYMTDIANCSDKRAAVIRDLVKESNGFPVAGVAVRRRLKPGEEVRADFIISWYTPNISFDNRGKEVTAQNAGTHYYTTHFGNAAAVAAYIADNYDYLKQQTFLWKRTWYDSTLPWWFLERTFANISAIATTSTHRFQSGRYYAWEGVGCCHGNCTHVYQYAHTVSRIFPELERDTRERVDLGPDIGFDEATGMIRIRGEKTGPSIDGQAGTVLRIYREHQMSPDNQFLQRNWHKIKKAVVFIMEQDKNHDGMEDTPMENTLDALWHGEISWIVGLCIAGVRAGQAMAEEMNDVEFAGRCRSYVEMGSKNMESELFNGEYFIHRADPAVGKKEIGSFNTCHIDQVYGQSWAWQVNLGRILSKEKTMSALNALWKYNYMPDVGPYIKTHPGGRFYALAGEGGMIMNTNPSNEENPYGDAKAWQIGYFSECMSGFEHQVASHMMAEGMVEESMVLTRSIHDRYHAHKRNPFNEIECSDHYGRAMASYGTFVNACGFTYHGPKGHIGFAPKIAPENFKAPYTAAEGWGSYSQQRDGNSFAGQLAVLHGMLMLKAFTVELDKGHKAAAVDVKLGQSTIACGFSLTDSRCEISFNNPATINRGEVLSIKIS